MDKPTEQEIRAFVGPKADHYLQSWQASLDGTGSGTGFNTAAFLLSGLWLPYRKMYRISAIFFGVILLETLLEEVLFVGLLGLPETPSAVLFLVGIAAWIICGVFGNHWYLSHTCRAIADVRRQGLPEEAHLQALAERGGTSVGASAGFFVLFMAALFGILLLLESILGTGPGTKVDFGSGEEIYYRNGATEADARTLATVLREQGFFDGRSAKSVRLSFDGDRVVIGFIIQERAMSRPELQKVFTDLGQQASRQAFGGRPVVVELCDEFFTVKKRL